MTKAAIEETTIVRIVAQQVMMKEFPNTVQKFIFFIALGKLSSVKPCAPISARGSLTISPLVLNTLMTTMMNGKIKQKNRRSSTTHIIAWEIFFFRAALSFSVITLRPPLSYRP